MKDRTLQNLVGLNACRRQEARRYGRLKEAVQNIPFYGVPARNRCVLFEWCCGLQSIYSRMRMQRLGSTKGEGYTQPKNLLGPLYDKESSG